MRLVLTGATGFLGRRLMARLPNAEALPRVDLADADSAAAVLASFRWDALVNLAGPVPKGIEDWRDGARTLAAHARIAMNLARMVPETCRVVHVSSMVVYGLPEARPVTEDHPRNPLHPYGLGKVLAEDALRPRRDCWLLRVGGLYSEERKDGALYHFLRAAKEGRPIRLTANTPLAWDVLHVDDAVDAIVRALEVPGEGPMNVSTGEPLDLTGVAHRVAERFGGVVEDVGGAKHPVFQADVSKLRRRLGWMPRPLNERLDAWWRTL